MKNIILTLVMLSAVPLVQAQSSSGLVAHWDMNGGTADVSGNGHDGHPVNVTPTVGRAGLPNTAYYFNGLNSVITAPYMPDLNMTKFSICTKLKAQGFYGGLCQGNYVIARGVESTSPGNWSLRFDDNAYNSCYVLDTTRQVFISTAGTNAPSLASAWQYTPTMLRDKWYNVTVTYDSTTWRIYIDCTLINTIVGPGAPIGTSLDSLAIGMNIWHSPAYPYPFKGVIDDIRVYNRVLHDTEIMQYCDTCGNVSTQPTDVMAVVGSTATFTTASTIPSPMYQWQHSTGTGFVNLANGGAYSGVHTPTLTITGITTTMSGSNYRCVVSNETDCLDISDSAELIVPVTIAEINAINNVKIYPNPTKSTLTVAIPTLSGEGKLVIFDELGRNVGTWQITSQKTEIDMNNLKAGMYIARIYVNGHVVFRTITKL